MSDKKSGGKATQDGASTKNIRDLEYVKRGSNLKSKPSTTPPPPPPKKS